MDTKVEIKEEDSLSNDVASQSETELFHEGVAMKRNSDDVLLNMAVKTETPFAKHLINAETVTCSNNWEIDRKTEIDQQNLISDFSAQNKQEFHSENPVIQLGKFNSDHEKYNNKIEIKEDPLWLEIETSSVCDDIKDGDFPTVESARLCTEAVSGANSDKFPVPTADVSGTHTSFYQGTDHLKSELKKSDIEMLTAEEYVLSDQSSKCSEGEEGHIWSLYQKQKLLIHMSNKPYQNKACDTKVSHLETLNLVSDVKKLHQCKTCGKSFTRSGDLKRHNMIHEGSRPHQCKICDKSFSDPSALKRHTFIHEGRKPHKCKTCDKSFTDLSNLKLHNMIHEGKKPHQCKICNKSFTLMSRLKYHNLIHEGKKPYQCTNCGKSFAQLSNLKTHNMLHEGKRPHQCKTCGKSFTRLFHLKNHNWIHEGKKPHQCKICGKGFTQLSYLKIHNLIHEGKKPHKCKTCDKSFTQISQLTKHNLIHEGKKLHQCESCGMCYTDFYTLKRHYLIIHEGRRPYKCEICRKSFTQLSNLKTHTLIHEHKK